MSNINGTNLASGITPFTTDDTYATHYEDYGKGGYRTVNTIADKEAISTSRQKVGMLVHVLADDITYRLKSDGTWEKTLIATQDKLDAKANVTDVSEQINIHNTSTTAHEDIRNLIESYRVQIERL